MKKFSDYSQLFSTIAVLILLFSCSTGYNKHADQYYEEGLVFYERMEYGRAVDNFTKVLELAPYGSDNNKVYYNRGMAYLKNRQYDKSIYDFTKALETTPASDRKLKFDILDFRGTAYQKSNEFDYAIKDYSDAIALMPKEKNIKYIYNSRAWSWYQKGDYDKAIGDFNKAISIDPEFDVSYYGRAFLWLQKEDPQRALIDAKEAVKLRPGNKKYDDLLYEIKSSIDKQ